MSFASMATPQVRSGALLPRRPLTTVSEGTGEIQRNIIAESDSDTLIPDT